MFAHCLTHEGSLKAIREQVRFARARIGTYELMDFVAVVIGYVLSGEPTLQTFYERLAPFAELFMSLFERNQLPHRSTLSRYLSALDQPTVEALRTLFQEDLLARTPFASPGGLFDRTGGQWTWIARDVLPANGRCRRWSRCPHLIVVSIRFVRRAIKAASGERLCVRGR